MWRWFSAPCRPIAHFSHTFPLLLGFGTHVLCRYWVPLGFRLTPIVVPTSRLDFGFESPLQEYGARLRYSITRRDGAWWQWWLCWSEEAARVCKTLQYWGQKSPTVWAAPRCVGTFARKLPERSARRGGGGGFSVNILPRTKKPCLGDFVLILLFCPRFPGALQVDPTLLKLRIKRAEKPPRPRPAARRD